ncbi:Superfamily I DNA and RNA helicase-like protein OS=Streptomyces glaucescens OX=1907 GN=SGLAU_11105 PE=4 SV=1 [Streptomyces glaucescens]
MRLGLTDSGGRRLLVDWRSPAAEPFFAATHADPMGLASRRRYRWAGGRVSDYWDEVFAADRPRLRRARRPVRVHRRLGRDPVALMRDVLATIQADQDAVILLVPAAPSSSTAGPGTGKTVVALPRSAYLLYADPRLGPRRAVLFVGPTGPTSTTSPTPPTSARKACGPAPCATSSPRARRRNPRPPLKRPGSRRRGAGEGGRAGRPAPRGAARRGRTGTVEGADIRLSAADWAPAFAAPAPGTPHYEVRDLIWEELVTILWDQYDGDVSQELFRRALARNEELTGTLRRAWPLLEAADLVGDLWSVPAYLRMCAPWLTKDEVSRLQRKRPAGVDGVRPAAAGRGPATARRPGGLPAPRRHQAAVAAERTRMEAVIDNVLAADHDGESAVTMLHGRDLRDSLVDEGALPGADRDPLAGLFAHVIVDEAQELTDAEWQMCCCAARPAASRSSATAPRPGTGSPSPGGNGWSGSGSTGSRWPR